MMELTDCDDVKGLIIKNGLLVGVELKNFSGRTVYCFPGQSVTVYYASDDDGVGSTDREDVACLVCI